MKTFAFITAVQSGFGVSLAIPAFHVGLADQTAALSLRCLIGTAFRFYDA